MIRLAAISASRRVPATVVSFGNSLPAAPAHPRNELGAQVGEVEHLESCASVKVLELLIFWLRNLGAHPLSLEHLETGFEHLEFAPSRRPKTII